MRNAIVLLALLAPAAAMAEGCRFEAPRNLKLELEGINTLVVELGRHELRLTGSPDGDGTVTGKACATKEELLDHLQVEQSRDGDRLLLRAFHAPDHNVFVFFGSHYERLVLEARIPDSLPVELQVRSGDAWVDGVAALNATVGSGDLEVRDIKGPLQARVGSGDLDARDVGSMQLHSVGSGDAEIRIVRGDASVGSVGSGDVRIERVDGSVKLGTLGSGDIELIGIAGGVEMESVGSGDLDVRDVGGDFTLHNIGSGDVSHSGVKGKETLPRGR